MELVTFAKVDLEVVRQIRGVTVELEALGDPTGNIQSDTSGHSAKRFDHTGNRDSDVLYVSETARICHCHLDVIDVVAGIQRVVEVLGRC